MMIAMEKEQAFEKALSELNDSLDTTEQAEILLQIARLGFPPKPYRHGQRIIFGRGDLRVSEGTIDATPALMISDEGTGLIGDDLGNSAIPSGREKCAFIFENIESLDVVIVNLKRLRARFDD